MMKMLAAIAALGTFVVGHAAMASDPCPSKEITSFTVPGGSFGKAVDIDGDIAVVAAGPIPGVNFSILRVFERDVSGQWHYSGLLGSDDLQWYDNFGVDFSVSNGRIAVLASNKIGALTGIHGVVYIFEKVGVQWKQTTKLEKPVPGFWPHPASPFGVEITDEVLVVYGANGFGGGGLFVTFARDRAGWSHAATIHYPFGRAESLGLSPSVLAIRVYDMVVIYDHQAGVPVGDPSTFVDPSLSSPMSVSVAGSRVLAGFEVFERVLGTWSKVAAISSSLQGQILTTALAADRVVGVAPNVPTGGVQGVGAASVAYFEDGIWTETLLLAPDDPSSGMTLGNVLAASGSTAVIGSPDSLNGAGAVFFFDLTPNASAKYGVGCVGAGGFRPSLGFSNSFDGCYKSFDTAKLAIQNGLGGALCLLGIGTSPASAPLAGGCQLLVHPSPISPIFALPGIGPGIGGVEVVATLPPSVASGSIYLQAITVDSAAAGGLSASNGLRLTLN